MLNRVGKLRFRATQILNASIKQLAHEMSTLYCALLLGAFLRLRIAEMAITALNMPVRHHVIIHRRQ